MTTTIIHYTLDRLKEASTARGLIMFVFGLVGYSLSEEEVTSIITVSNILAGIIGIVIPDSLGDKNGKS
jgi:hypothetical protein